MYSSVSSLLYFWSHAILFQFLTSCFQRTVPMIPHYYQLCHYIRNTQLDSIVQIARNQLSFFRRKLTSIFTDILSSLQSEPRVANRVLAKRNLSNLHFFLYHGLIVSLIWLPIIISSEIINTINNIMIGLTLILF